MVNAVQADLIEDFLGSTHTFALALADVMEGRLLRETTQGQLTSAQIKLLKLIEQADGQTVGDVASFLGVSNAAASKIVNRLVRRSFLKRGEAATDRRTSELGLTAAGRQLLGEYETARRRRLTQVFREFSAEELQHTAQVLDQLAGSIVTHSANPEEVCLQCGVYFKERCLLQELMRRDCQYRQRKGKTSPGLSPHGRKGTG